MKCLEQNCNNQIESKTGRKKFCSNKCKMKHFRKVGKKNIVTKADIQILFNEFKAAIQEFSKRANNGTLNNVAEIKKEIISEHKPMFPKSAQIIKSVEEWVAEKRAIELEEDFVGFQKRLDEATYLSDRQKKLIRIS